MKSQSTWNLLHINIITRGNSPENYYIRVVGFCSAFFLYKKSLHFFANATTTTSACSSRQPDCFDLRSLNYNHHSLLPALPTTQFFTNQQITIMHVMMMMVHGNFLWDPVTDWGRIYFKELRLCMVDRTIITINIHIGIFGMKFFKNLVWDGMRYATMCVQGIMHVYDVYICVQRNGAAVYINRMGLKFWNAAFLSWLLCFGFCEQIRRYIICARE